MSDAVQPLQIAIPQADLDDVRERLRRTRWPQEIVENDFLNGTTIRLDAGQRFGA